MTALIDKIFAYADLANSASLSFKAFWKHDVHFYFITLHILSIKTHEFKVVPKKFLISTSKSFYLIHILSVNPQTQI